MKKIHFIVISLFLITTVITNSSSAEKLADGIAAIVQNKVITFAELNEKAGPALSQQGGILQKKEIYSQVLEGIVAQHLIAIELADKGMNVLESEINAAIDDVVRQNKITRDVLIETLKRQGYTFESYKKEIEGQIQRMKFVAMIIRPQVNVTDTDVQNYYSQNVKLLSKNETVKAKHILFKLPLKPEVEKVNEIKKKANDIYNQILKGGSFEELAKQFSDDPSASKGGDLGEFKRGEMISEIEEIAFTLKDGEVSKPFRSAIGYHILKLVEKKVTSTKDFKSVSGKIRMKLMRDAEANQLSDWIEKKKKDIYLKVMLDDRL